jgi:hypothetical protein
VEQVRRRRRQAAQSRKIRARLGSGAAVCLVGVVAFMAATMWKRSRDRDAETERKLNVYVLVPLKEAMGRLNGQLPLRLPDVVPGADTMKRYHYPAPAAVIALRRRQEPVIVGYSPPASRLLRGKAYFAVIFDPAALQACLEGAGGLARCQDECLRKCLDECLRVQRLEEAAFCRQIGAQTRWLQERGRGRPVSRGAPKGVAGSRPAA